jgi:anthranilate phosphoribosyltransferase
LKAAFLRALADKRETAGEIHALAEALLPHAVSPGFTGSWHGESIFDCAGTGGGGLPLINISTGIIFILAALGVPVVKHGNRGVTKQSGSADVLMELGIGIDVTPAQLRATMERVGAAFIFAPHYHPLFARLAPVRQLLAKEGRRTVFNLLGPVLNPARPEAQMVGVFESRHLALYGEALKKAGRQRWLVVRGMDTRSNRAIGELSVTGTNAFASGLLEGEDPTQWTVAQSAGELETLHVKSAAEGATRLVAILEGREKGLGRALILANAAAGLCVQGKIRSYHDAFMRCEEALDRGDALKKLHEWQAFSSGMKK